VKKILNSKIFVGIICFCLGFLANHYLTKLVFHSEEIKTADNEHFAVNPDDFDKDKMMDAMKRVQQDMMKDADIGVEIKGVDRREDDKFVYYDIPLNANEKNHELKVNVQDGMISIAENTPNSQSERQFSIDPGLDETKADVQTLKDKISIKIPKKK
jgi:hypothetical protein